MTNLNTYHVVLSSVASAEDTISHVVHEESKDKAVAAAMMKSDHWYTDVVSAELSNINHEVITMENVNKSAIISSMAGELFHNGLNPRMAYIVATAYTCAAEYLEEGFEDFMEAFIDGLEITELSVVGAETPEDEFNTEAIVAALEAGNYLNGEEIGPRFAELLEQRTEAYAPIEAGTEWTRKFSYAPEKGQESRLFKEAIHALESTEYTVDSHMLSVALQVLGKTDNKDDEGYVIKGCQAMDSGKAYVSEFKGDRRGRMYQASCHGPNGQSSDRSRALMNLVGVPTDYDVSSVKKIILAELADMVSCVKTSAVELKEMGDVDFIVKHLDGNSGVKKPWSFVKGAKIMRELQAGQRPYIGMAVGLDAKCSGPQLGALMTGDQAIAAACGFTMQELNDAYHIAIQHCEQAGFTGISRAGIKKAYMGIFYGQGWAAFTDTAAMLEGGQHELVASLYPAGLVSDDVAKAFHKAVSTSFGVKMANVRQMVKGYANVTEGRTKHFMPDGFQVAMNYKVKVNALGEALDWDTEQPDVRIQNNAEVFKFIKFAVKTKTVHVGDFARNGFVNMIQATDALMARLIVVNLARLGAKHIISVHDCFRVNVTEMHLLEKAIILSYAELFGANSNCPSSDLPKGLDILGMYFDGANAQLVDGEQPKMVSQFFTSGSRRMKKVNGVPMLTLINAEESYYFAK